MTPRSRWSGRVDCKVFFKIETNLKRLSPDVDKPSFVIPHWVERDEKDDYSWHRQDRMIPVEFLGDPVLVKKWTEATLVKHKPKSRREIAVHLASVGRRLLDAQCPVEVLTGRLAPQDHANMFSLLNVAGTDLTIFDLLVARLSPLNISLRKLWRESKAIHSELNECDIDPVYILKVAALIAQTNALEDMPTCRKKDLPEITTNYDKENGSIRHQFEANWRQAAHYLAEALSWFKVEFGVCHRKLVPYAPMLITLAATLWWVKSAEKRDQRFFAAIRRKLARWYWGQ